MKNPKKGLVSRYDTVVITAEVTVQTSDVAATCAKAAKDGNLPALKWLREMGQSTSSKSKNIYSANSPD